MSKDEMAARLLARAGEALRVSSLGRGMNDGGRGVSITLRVLRLPHGEGLPLPDLSLRACRRPRCGGWRA